MQLESERLILRPYKMEDAKAASALADDKEIAARTFIPHPYKVEDAQAWISTHDDYLKEGSAYPLAMIDKESGRLTGTMTLRVNTKHKNGELAYWVGQPFWGRGYASEAAQCVTDFGFDTLELERIWGRALSDNEASQKVMKKVGLLYEGMMRHDVFHDNEFKNTYMYGMIRADRRN